MTERGLHARLVPALPAADGSRTLAVDLLALDLRTCARCVPTEDTVRKAIRLVEPAAAAMGIRIRFSARVIRDAAEAIDAGFESSPTIRINGRDIAGALHESVCESCGDIAGACGDICCRDWSYRGRTWHSPPLPFLLESLMRALADLDDLPPVKPAPLSALPENLRRFFAAAR